MTRMRNMLLVCAAVGAVGIAGAIATTVAGPAVSQPGPAVNFTNEYAVKFVCGPMEPILDVPFVPQVVRGNYATAINIHNPGRTLVFERKIAVASPGAPGEVTGFERLTLRNDQALELGCNEIFGQLRIRPEFRTGFLVIHTQRELDVVAVYTAGADNNGQVTTLHTERVPLRRVAIPITVDPGRGSTRN